MVATPDRAHEVITSLSVRPSHHVPRNTDGYVVRSRLQAFLRSLGTTLYQISRATEVTPFGKGTRAYICDAFYSKLEHGQTPDVYQVAALAQLTGYSFTDCLRMFGHDISDVLRLQLALHADRTTVLANLGNLSYECVPYLLRLAAGYNLGRTAPLLSAVDAIGYAPISTLSLFNRRRYLYAHVGSTDSTMHPGAIVRVDPTKTTIGLDKHSKPIYLVQHGNGMSFCRIAAQSDQHVILILDRRGTRVVRLSVSDIGILGAVDLEFRSLQPLTFNASSSLHQGQQDIRALKVPNSRLGGTGAGAYVQMARRRIGMHFRDAHSITARIAEYFGDDEFHIALGSLSDMEADSALPHSIPKIFSLCATYSMDLHDYLVAGGLTIADSGGKRIPADFLTSGIRDELVDHGIRLFTDGALAETDALATVVSRLNGELPFFLLPFLGPTSGHEYLSIDQIYLCGAGNNTNHSDMHSCILFIIDTQDRAIPRLNISSSQIYPLFLARLHSVEYVVTMCTRDANNVILHRHSKTDGFVCETVPSHNIQIMGKVTAVLRTIGTNENDMNLSS